MILQEEWVRKIKEGDLVGLLGGECLNPVIFKTWNGQSAYNGHRAQYYWVPSNLWGECTTQVYWDNKFESLKDPDNWAHHISTVNARAEFRFIPYPMELLCKNQKKYIKQLKH